MQHTTLNQFTVLWRKFRFEIFLERGGKHGNATFPLNGFKNVFYITAAAAAAQKQAVHIYIFVIAKVGAEFSFSPESSLLLLYFFSSGFLDSRFQRNFHGKAY